MKTGAMQLDISGPVSVLILVTAASAIVPPPQNVTVSCQNLQTTIYWDYSNQQPQPETSFRLYITGSTRHAVRLTEEHQYDLTPFVWESVERYTGFHFVQVTAIQGNQESKKVDSPSFTFNYLKAADKQCKLDFPPVDLTVKESEATVSFQNPYQFYKELRQATLKQDGLIFDFSVTSDDEYEGSCGLKDTICRRDFTVLQSQKKYCITLEGNMYDSNKFNRVQFKETGPICADQATDQDSHLILLAVLLSAFVIAVLVIILAVCKAKAWVISPSTRPKSLEPLLPNTDVKVMDVTYEPVSTVVAVEPETKRRQSSEEDPSETQTDSTLSDLCPTTSTSSLFMEGGLSDSSNQEMETEELTSESCVSEDAHTEGMLGRECVNVNLEGDEEPMSPYDCPHRLEVDMGHGDVVEGYSGR